MHNVVEIAWVDCRELLLFHDSWITKSFPDPGEMWLYSETNRTSAAVGGAHSTASRSRLRALAPGHALPPLATPARSSRESLSTPTLPHTSPAHEVIGDDGASPLEDVSLFFVTEAL